LREHVTEAQASSPADSAKCRRGSNCCGPYLDGRLNVLVALCQDSAVSVTACCAKLVRCLVCLVRFSSCLRVCVAESSKNADGDFTSGIWRAKSKAALVGFLSELHAIKIDLFLHQQGLDTTTPAGKAMFQMMGVFAEFERAMIQERVRAGLKRAVDEGKQLGRHAQDRCAAWRLDQYGSEGQPRPFRGHKRSRSITAKPSRRHAGKGAQ
jgi:Resolvase, N terminal domain